jgi:hypothetical protein
MLRALLLLLVGEGLALYGLWLAWPPLAFMAAGAQLVAAALARETGDSA